MYLTSVAANTLPYHMEIADYLDANPKIKLCFQPGTFQMKLGLEELKRIYARTDLLVVNLEEARRLLGMDEKSDIKFLMKSLADRGPKLVAITNSISGSYLFDGDHY